MKNDFKQTPLSYEIILIKLVKEYTTGRRKSIKIVFLKPYYEESEETCTMIHVIIVTPRIAVT
jgi:hypothetical protein